MLGVGIHHIVTAAIICGCVLIVLHVVALRLGWSRELHLLKIEAHRLRAEYARRLDRMRSGDTVDLDPIEVGSIDEPTPAKKKAA